MTLKPALLATLGFLLLSGCVSKSKYVQLEGSLDQETSMRLAAEERADEAEAQLANSRQEVTSLEEALSNAEAEVTRLNSEAASQQERLERLLKDLKGKATLEASLAEMRGALADLDRRKALADERVAAYKDLLGRFQQLIDAGTLKVKIVDGRMIVELATDVLFASGSAKLSDAGREAIVEVTTVLGDIPGRRYQIEGHTDSVPISTAQFPSNWELASARALSVVRVMTDNGLTAERISAASFASYRPTQSNDSDEGKAANRRIEIVVLPDLSGLPGYDELKALSN